METKKIGVIGAGSWGTALAFHLAGKGFPVHLWVYEPEVHASIRTQRENVLFLPGVRLPDNILSTNSLEETGADIGGCRQSVYQR